MRLLFSLALLLISIHNWVPPAAAQSKTAPYATSKASKIEAEDMRKIERYMRALFGNQRIRVIPRANKLDSAEVYVAEEFIGVVFLDAEDGDRSFQFQMAILESELK